MVVWPFYIYHPFTLMLKRITPKQTGNTVTSSEGLQPGLLCQLHDFGAGPGCSGTNCRFHCNSFRAYHFTTRCLPFLQPCYDVILLLIYVYWQLLADYSDLALYVSYKLIFIFLLDDTFCGVSHWGYKSQDSSWNNLPQFYTVQCVRTGFLPSSLHGSLYCISLTLVATHAMAANLHLGFTFQFLFLWLLAWW